jgi:hypothetical protein
MRHRLRESSDPLALWMPAFAGMATTVIRVKVDQSVGATGADDP